MQPTLNKYSYLKCLALLVVISPLLSGCFIWTSGSATKPSLPNLLPPVEDRQMVRHTGVQQPLSVEPADPCALLAVVNSR